MENKLVARDNEILRLKKSWESDESEFVIVYGRRRVGKTFLIEEFFDRTYDFKFVGGHRLSDQAQLDNFAKALYRYSKKKWGPFSKWSEAFDALQEYIESIKEKRKKVIFIDEMPWIDQPWNDFVSDLEYFWNNWAASRDDILLVATGSASSWMIEHLVENAGGLHNRISPPIHLSPFTLRETELYLKRRRFPWTRYQILQCYMLTGGVPFYLKQLDPKLSIAQNIDNLCFKPKAMLREEFDDLYPALFSNAATYVSVVHQLYLHKKGMTRSEIIASTHIEGNTLTKILKNLERSDFIAIRAQYGNKKKGAIYHLVDFYTIFYYKFIESDTSLNARWWSQNMKTPGVYAWMGLAFERICLLHYEQIKHALGIAGISTAISGWRYTPPKKSKEKGAQIDMVIERADQMIHLCEMKFSVEPYTVDNDYEEYLRKRGELFRERTQTRNAILHTFVTTYGVKNAAATDVVDCEVTMDDLFNS